MSPLKQMIDAQAKSLNELNTRERDLISMNLSLAERIAILSELLTRTISGRRIEEQYYREYGGEG